jgi:predicted Rossmann-fold nucleotide-binding protein
LEGCLLLRIIVRKTSKLNQLKMKSICVYCGANFNGDPQLLKAIQQLADAFVTRHIRLVYGGGSVGVMGVIADEVLKLGGKVTGVIPQFLMDKEVGHKHLLK